ncbi:MAG: glycosyltransferase [bacterium]
MKILYVITSTTIGGAERKLHSIITGLDRARFEPVGVISLKPAGPVAELIGRTGVPVVSLDMGYIPSLSDLDRLATEIKKFNPDVVNAFLYRAIQFCRMVLSFRSGSFRLICSTEVNYRSRAVPLRWIDRLLRRGDDITVCESQAGADFMTKNLGYEESGVLTVKNGIDPFRWVFTANERRSIRNRLKVADDETLVCSAGRLSRQKGQEFLIDALAGINRPHKIKCVILGDGPDRPLLQKKIISKRLSEKIILAGETPDIRPWFCASDIFALPSRWEGIPMVLLEAMAMGLPCAASAVDGIPEVVQDGKNGLLFPKGDTGALALALLKLSRDIPFRNSIALNAKKTVRDGFTLKKMIAGYERVYIRGRRPG